MTVDRERQVTEAFVSLANSMADGRDPVDLLTSLSVDCARLLDVASVGLLLADHQGSLHVLAASSEATRDLELFQLQCEQGPCLDCFRNGETVSVADLDSALPRWPQFVPVATAAGFASLHAIPMRLRENRLGAMGLFGDRPGSLNAEDQRLGQALAHVASVALVQDKTASDQTAITEQLQTALNSRVVLEQAKGVLAECGRLDMDQAFAALRKYARDHNGRLTDLARAVVSRELHPQLLLEHASAGSNRSGATAGSPSGRLR